MKEKILNMKNEKDYTKLEKAGEIIKKGGLVLFPTETVYGIGANGFDEKAVEKIFIAKGRPGDNPLILHIADMKMLEEIAVDISETEKKLMESFWPGPFTIILNKSTKVPLKVTAGLETVAVRMPKNEIAKKLIKYANVPIAAPSANISGKPSGTNLEDIIDELKDKVDYCIDGGNCEIGLESTVVKVIDEKVHILRPGKITKEMLELVIKEVEIDSHILGKLEENEKVLSPGMKHRHYAPSTKCILVYSENQEAVVKKIKEIKKQYEEVLILTTTENKKQYENTKIIDIGSKNKLEEISKNIFTDLRKIDNYNVQIAIIEGVAPQGIGLAIMNRLIRACEYNYIKC